MATNVYIRFAEPEIRGDVAESAHAGAVQVLSWSHSFAQPIDASRSAGAAAEPARHSDLTFSKYFDSSTSELLRHCWSSQKIGSAELSAYRSEGEAPATLYLTIRLEDVLVSSVSVGGGPGDLPTENISLSYGRISYTYHGADGADAVSHDLLAGALR